MGCSTIYKILNCIVIAIVVVMVNYSCSNSSPKSNTNESTQRGYYDYRPYNSAEATRNEASDANTTMQLQPYSDSYEDGYIDGEAAAEEDRLARKPGMQSGGEDDEDDDDYEDGYDDGYEDY